MTNYEKRIEELNIDKLIILEDEILECENCYCREFCNSKQNGNDTCTDVRREWLSMKANDITDTLQGDYYYPDFTLPPQENKPIGIYGRRHAEYLKCHKKIFYYNMLTSGRLNEYLADINGQAVTMRNKLICDMKAAENVTEKLKEKDMLAWVQAVNNIAGRVDEIINQTLIYK